MFVKLTTERFLLGRSHAIGDVVKLDEARAKVLIEEKHGIADAGPATNPCPEDSPEDAAVFAKIAAARAAAAPAAEASAEASPTQPPAKPNAAPTRPAAPTIQGRPTAPARS